jgi:hypothetical protein
LNAASASTIASKDFFTSAGKSSASMFVLLQLSQPSRCLGGNVTRVSWLAGESGLGNATAAPRCFGHSPHARRQTACGASARSRGGVETRSHPLRTSHVRSIHSVMVERSEQRTTDRRAAHGNGTASSAVAPSKRPVFAAHRSNIREWYCPQARIVGHLTSSGLVISIPMAITA